jgi:hypothetical protein
MTLEKTKADWLSSLKYSISQRLGWYEHDYRRSIEDIEFSVCCNIADRFHAKELEKTIDQISSDERQIYWRKQEIIRAIMPGIEPEPERWDEEAKLNPISTYAHRVRREFLIGQEEIARDLRKMVELADVARGVFDAITQANDEDEIREIAEPIWDMVESKHCPHEKCEITYPDPREINAPWLAGLVTNFEKASSAFKGNVPLGESYRLKKLLEGGVATPEAAEPHRPDGEDDDFEIPF